ncbi:unnamed protein product, partial [Bubo scandiacus]
MADLHPHACPHLELPARSGLGGALPPPPPPAATAPLPRCWAQLRISAVALQRLTCPPPCLQPWAARGPKLSPRALLPPRAGLGTLDSPLSGDNGPHPATDTARPATLPPASPPGAEAAGSLSSKAPPALGLEEKLHHSSGTTDRDPPV